MYQMLCFPQKKGKEFFRGLQYEAILSFTKCALAPSPVVLLLVNTFALLPECVHLLHCSLLQQEGVLLHHIFSGNLLCGFTVFLYHLMFLSFFSSFLPLLLFSFTPACLLSPLLFLLLLLLSISCLNTHRNMAQHSEWHQQVRCHHKCKAVDLSVELASAALFSSKTCCRIFSIC